MEYWATLNNIFRVAVVHYPENTALVFYKRRITYRELDFLASKFANFLREQFILPGERVALILPNCPQFVIAYLGVLKAGCVVVPFNPLAGTEEILEMIRQTRPELIISLKDFSRHNRAIYKTLKGFQKMAVISLAEYLPGLLKWLYRLKNIFKSKPWSSYSWKEIIKTQSERALPKVSPADLAVLQFTGGTTGSPKAAKLTHSNLVNNTIQALRMVGGELINKKSVFMGVLPFWHVYGLTVCLNIALARGSSIIVLPRFRSKEVLKAIPRKSVTLFPAVPRMFAALVKEITIYESKTLNKIKLDSLKICVSGAGALDPAVKKEFEILTGASIIEGYGLSETSPIVCINPPNNSRPGSLGVPVPDTQIKIADDGELFVKGPQVMIGYWGKPEETAAVLSKDGWLATGDIVRKDEEGFLWMEDRKKDMIKRRGENVYSIEIEKIINQHPQVRETAVVGMPGKDDEQMIACVVLKTSPQDISPADIIEHCGKYLPKYKVPDEVRFFNELPKNILGKVLKKELRKKFIKLR